jgi:molecular chaperone HtpG
MEKIKSVFEADTTNPVLKDYADLLFDLAVISEGGKIDNPSRFSKLMGEMMTKAL